MKILTSNTEGVWLSPTIVQLTAEEHVILQSEKETDTVAKAALLETIKTNRETPASAEDATEGQTIYEFNKPVLKETDTYQLISVDLRIDGLNKNGIINCRVNGDHKQIRF
jgi:hypothetical protein